MKSIPICWKFIPYMQYHFICDYLAGAICHVPTPSVLRKAETEGEVYLLLTTKTAAAVTFSCKANMLEKVTICCGSSVLGPNMSGDDGKTPKFGRKLLYGLCQEGMYNHSSSWKVEPRRNFGLEKYQDKIKNFPLLLPSFW